MLNFIVLLFWFLFPVDRKHDVIAMPVKVKRVRAFKCRKSSPFLLELSKDRLCYNRSSMHFHYLHIETIALAYFMFYS